MSEGLVVHEPETGVIVDVNERFCEMNGYEQSELIGEPIGIVMTDDEAYGPQAATEMMQQARTEGPQRFEWRNRRRDGKTFPVEVDLTVIELDGEERVLASVQDITERKRREQEYEQIFNGVEDPIAVFDPDTGDITEVNEPYRDMIGYDDLETIQELGIEGMSPSEGEYTAERGTALIREVSTTSEPKTVEWEAETAGGDRRYLDITLSPAVIRGEKRVLSIQRDVTERKRREQEYEQIFNGVQDAIAVFDPGTLEFLDANEAYLEMFDHESLGELRERGVSGLSVTKEGYTEQRGREVHQRVVESDEPEIVEWQGETSSGERVWLEVKVAPAVIGGEQRTVSIQRDITERKRRKQRLEVFNRILRHNLRNRLDVIQSHAEELQSRTTGDHAERIVAAVDDLAGVGRRARQVDQILSKEDNFTEIDITQRLREIVETMEAIDSDIVVRTDFPKEARLQTDEESITMAVESALENALGHAASAVAVAVDDRPTEHVITIADDGPGIPEEELRPIEAQTETRLQHGRGLGLWQLRWCVDNLNGELTIETDTGTTVRITVPKRRNPGQSV
ncbi:PAS domain S-box protein [Halapricum sp. CBA1109]|uniref:PAS domain-containing protein n=1 Tax=Halapricum sp. CBA1109 TaxID=2668068 RepID=UPI00351BB10A